MNHSKYILIGHSDSYADDKCFLKITMHHNWYKGARQGHPRVRLGEAHCFKNWFEDNELYGVASTCDVAVVVEGNSFKNVPFPTYVGYAESPAGDLIDRSNLCDSTGIPQMRGTAFDPSKYYFYTMDAAASVAA